MKKGVAIPYIVAILLGIAVIGLIGFWLFKSTGIFGTKAVEQTCRNNFLKWCQDWFADGYSKEWMIGTSGTKIFFNSKYQECKVYQLPGTDCLAAGVGCQTSGFSNQDDAVNKVKEKCFVG